MCPLRPHALKEIDSTKKNSHLGKVLGFLHLFETNVCEPVSKPISFLDGPFAFERIDGEAIGLQLMKYFVK